MFQVYHSNQLDLLKELIAHLMENDPLTHPFEQEIVLVQSPGMSQWLQIELAKRFGIAANINYPLPATFIWDMFRRVLPDIPKESAYTKQAMTWKLMTILPTVINEAEFEPLRHYLNDDSDKRKLHQLSGRIADLFDQYLVYRPEWISHWQRNELIEGLSSNQLWQKDYGSAWSSIQRNLVSRLGTVQIYTRALLISCRNHQSWLKIYPLAYLSVVFLLYHQCTYKRLMLLRNIRIFT